MAGSTYSTNLKIELMTTGENSGTWGDITNTNLGTALEQAIVGYGNPDYVSDANLTISITNSNAAQAARALVLNVTSVFGALTATRELVVPTIQKQYIVQNNTTGGQSITVKTSAGTGITVPNGRKAHLYVDGTNVIQMFDFVDINGGTIDGATIGANSASTGAFTTLAASGATTLNGAVTLGDAAGDNITFNGTVTSHLLFTDNTYDIGASGATRPRNLYLAGAATIGGNLSVGGTLTLTGGVNLNGNVTVGDSAADTLTINSTITSNLIFTDNTYDIGASGATRPRNLFLAGNATIGGAQTLTGALTVDSTTDSSSTTTGSIQTDGGLGVAKALYVGTTLNTGGIVTIGAAQSTSGQLVIQNTTTRANGNKYGIRFADSTTETNASIYVTQLNAGNNQASLTIAVNNATGGANLTSANDVLFIGAGGTLGVGAAASTGAQLFVQSPTSTDAKLYVGAATGTQASYATFVNNYVTTIGTESSSGGALATGSTAYYSVLNSVSQGLQFATANNVRATVDTSGNWGYNIASLSAWSGMTALEFYNGQGLSFSANRGYVNGNAIWDGVSWKRKTAGYAVQYNFDYTAGQHIFSTGAYNASAGSNISWVTNTVIDSATGNLTNYGPIVVGTSSAANSVISVADGASSSTDARFLFGSGASTYAGLRMVFNSTANVAMDAVLNSNTNTTKNLLLQVNGGALGLGVGSISNWSLFSSVFQYQSGALVSYNSGSNIQTQLLNNLYYNSGYQYLSGTSAAASYYKQYDGRHIFGMANSGTGSATVNELAQFDINGCLITGGGSATTAYARLNTRYGSTDLLESRLIPISGNPAGGTNAGYLILCKTYDGVVGQARSFVQGTFYVSRGGTGSGNRTDMVVVNAQTAYSYESIAVQDFASGASNPYQGDYFLNIVKLTYNGDQYFALATATTGGAPDNNVTFIGTYGDAGMVMVDSTYVSGVTAYRPLNQTMIGNTGLVFNGVACYGYKYGSTTGTVTVANGATATITTLDTTDQNASYLLFMGQAGAGNAGIRAYAYIKQGGTVGSIYVIETSGGINSLSMSGINIQFTNGAGGLLTADWTLLKIAGGGAY
jgi:hypothetical protein